jgi:hypothetical protein
MPNSQKKPISEKGVKVGGTIVGIIGLVASILGIYDHFFHPSSDSQIRLVDSTKRITLSSKAQQAWASKLVVADEIDVDGVVAVPTETILVSNKLQGENGAQLVGQKFAVVATVISGVGISAEGSQGKDGARVGTAVTTPTPGGRGGEVVVATAQISNSKVSAAGGPGGSGLDGADKPQAAPGPDGSNGDCGGFGAYKGAKAGGNGAAGADAENGQDGAAGGTGGKVLMLTSGSLSDGLVNVGGGRSGSGGKPGSPGKGGNPGKGGLGCAGLGGSQPNETDGQPGPDGARGHSGSAPVTSSAGSLVVRNMAFGKVAAIYKRFATDPAALFQALEASDKNQQ